MPKRGEKVKGSRNGTGPVDFAALPDSGGYVDAETQDIAGMVKTHRDIGKLRQQLENRSRDLPHLRATFDPIIAAIAQEEKGMEKVLLRQGRRHYAWPILPIKGVAGLRIIAAIRDPRRYPGQPCSRSGADERGRRLRPHYHPPLYEEGDPCPTWIWRERKKVQCGAPLLAPRTGDGVPSLFHNARLHVDENGRSPRRRKGFQADWNPELSTAIIGPKEWADQILIHNKEPWRTIYDKKKAAKIEAGQVVGAHGIAKKVAGKAALKYFGIAWKRAVEERQRDTPT